MARIVQINLNHCSAAQDLLMQTMAEKCIDIAIISEQYRNLDSPLWINSIDSTAAIYARGSSASGPTPIARANGFCGVTIGSLHVYSCYFSTNADFEDYTRSIDRLRDVVALYSGNDIILAGDFNAKAVEWGSALTDSRGVVLSEMAASIDVFPANTGSKWTMRRWNEGSVVDVTFVTASLLRRVSDWQVLEDETLSDHLYISYNVVDHVDENWHCMRTRGWVVRKLDERLCGAVLSCMHAWTRGEEERGSAEDRCRYVTELLDLACSASMPRKAAPRRRPSTGTTGTTGTTRSLNLDGSALQQGGGPSVAGHAIFM